jgi:hypothetical protein
VAPRVQGKILEKSGIRFIVVEQKGRDIWRGRHKTVNEALEHAAATVGVDRVLLTRCANHDTHVVMVVIEDHRRIFLAKIQDLFDAEKSVSRTSYNGRSMRALRYDHWSVTYLGTEKTLRSHR